MPELPEVFHAKDEDTIDDGLKPLPAGWYQAQIFKSEFKEAASGKGQFLKLSFKVLDGEFKGRQLFANLNLIHENETTVQIAKRELASICKALDLESVLDSDELHGLPMQIKVNVRPATAKWPAGNDIKNYKNIDEVEMEGDDSNPFG